MSTPMFDRGEVDLERHFVGFTRMQYLRNKEVSLFRFSVAVSDGAENTGSKVSVCGSTENIR